MVKFAIDETDTLQWNARDNSELGPSCAEKRMVQINGEKESNRNNENEVESYHVQQNLNTHNQTNFHSMRNDCKVIENPTWEVSFN